MMIDVLAHTVCIAIANHLLLLFTVLRVHFENVASNVVSSHVRNSCRGMLHADSEDRPL